MLTCGNSDVFRNARQDREGKQTATCGVCGSTVRSESGTTMRRVTGGMRQER
ncbi:hypothetical protein [Micromonospora sp. WMMA2032]|uniref:hypothetical protein n=1 Tax=Micromonospora sp. WMMA2032 TaxID=2039870 RepID=UPI0012FD6049|nr:hypothetical protein [Micromonospora sp. WMMA2032]